MIGCSEGESANSDLNTNLPDEVTGVYYAVMGKEDPEAVYRRIVSALRGNANISVVAEVDHSENAASVGQRLEPTRLVLFGNPSLGTPLMQINPQAGLDLPQKILVYRAGNGATTAIYNSIDYLASRHSVGEAESLESIGEALAGLVASAGGAELQAAATQEVRANEGIVSFRNAGTVDSVYQNLKNAVSSNSKLKIIAEIDHQANAASVGMELPPIRLLVFGNPALGTPLLQEQQPIGLDLPQKMLVYAAADGEVVVAFNDPAFLAQRHGVENADLQPILDALTGLARQALSQ